MDAGNLRAMSNEDLVRLIREAEMPGGRIDSIRARIDAAYCQLFNNMRIAALIEARMYRQSLSIFDTDDFLQEANIVIWNLVRKNNFREGNFEKYFAVAYRMRLRNIYRDYILKNLVILGIPKEDGQSGLTVACMAEDPKAEEYRVRHREHCKKYNDKKRAERYAAEKAERAAKGLPEPKPKRELTPEELEAKHEARKARMREYNHSHKTPESMEANRKRSLAYYEAHREEINRKRREKKAKARAAKLDAEEAAEETAGENETKKKRGKAKQEKSGKSG